MGGEGSEAAAEAAATSRQQVLGALRCRPGLATEFLLDLAKARGELLWFF